MDWLLERKPFHQNAKAIIEPCINEEIQGFLACHTILNLFYLLRKDYSALERKDILLMLCNYFHIVGIDQEMLETALNIDNFIDIEDGTQIQCATKEKMDFIATRDVKGFDGSAVKVLSPEAFISTYSL